MEGLDLEYISNFEILEADYDKFYKEPVTKITLFFIYIDENKEVYNVNSDIEELENSYLTQERLLYLIKKNLVCHQNKHRLVDLLKFNIDLDHTELKNFFLNTFNDNYLISLKIVEDIKFNNTIPMLEDQNSVHFIFTNINNTHNTTRRIHIKSKQKKTRRKQ